MNNKGSSFLSQAVLTLNGTPREPEPLGRLPLSPPRRELAQTGSAEVGRGSHPRLLCSWFLVGVQRASLTPCCAQVGPGLGAEPRAEAQGQADYLPRGGSQGVIPDFGAMLLLPARGKARSRSTGQLVAKVKQSNEGPPSARGPRAFAGRSQDGSGSAVGHTDVVGSSPEACLGAGLACQVPPS